MQRVRPGQLRDPMLKVTKEEEEKKMTRPVRVEFNCGAPAKASERAEVYRKIE